MWNIWAWIGQGAEEDLQDCKDGRREGAPDVDPPAGKHTGKETPNKLARENPRLQAVDMKNEHSVSWSGHTKIETNKSMNQNQALEQSSHQAIKRMDDE